MGKEKKATRRSVVIPDDVYDNVKKLAVQKHITAAEVMRNLIAKGITVSFIEDSEGLVRRIVHDEVDLVMNRGVERLAKLTAKSAKTSASALYLLLLLIQSDYAEEETAQEMLTNALQQAAIYLKVKEKDKSEYVNEAKEFLLAAADITKRSDV